MPRLSPKAFRIVVGTLLVLLVGGLLAADYFFAERIAGSVVVVVLGLAGALEFSRLARAAPREQAGGAFPTLVCLTGTAWFLGMGWWEGVEGRSLPAEWVVGALVTVLLVHVAFLAFRGDFVERFPELPATLCGVVLFGLLFSYLLRVYHLGTTSEGLVRGVVLILGVKGTDITAYLVGSAFGRHRFLKVSPGKTLEGYAGALVFGAVWFSGAGWLYPDYLFGWSGGILFGMILAVTSSLGDLAGSLIKRHYRVKDSSALLPEFGGVLDLIDSLLFSAFVFWCLL